MKHDKKAELIACCESIIRNADKITADLEHDQTIDVTISMDPDAISSVSVNKRYVPKEMFEVLNGLTDN